MAGQADLKKILGGSDGVPVNGFVDLYEFDPVVTKGTQIYFKTGYVDSNVANYPNAQSMGWLGLITEGTPQGGFSQSSRMLYKFGQYIMMLSNAASTGQTSFLRSSDFVTFASSGGDTVTIGATQAPVLIYDSVGNAVLGYIGAATTRRKTTDGINYTQEAITGLSGQVIDVIRIPTIWVALTSAGIYSSADGLSWTLQQVWAAATATTQGKLGYNGTTIVASVKGKTNYYTSTNGTSWSNLNLPSNMQSEGWITYGNNIWQATMLNTLSNVVVSATSSTLSSWTLGTTAGQEGDYNVGLGVWLSNPRAGGGTTVAQSYSKNGVDWISTISTIFATQGWVEVSGKVYGVKRLSDTTPCSAAHLGQLVGIPYSLSSISISANKYLRVK